MRCLLCAVGLLIVVANVTLAQDDAVISALYQASPGDTEATQFSHHPVPFAYMSWASEVTKTLGLGSLAQCNRHLAEDLPPIAAAGDDAPPQNPELEARLTANPAEARRIAVAALTHDPARAQWSIIQGLHEYDAPELRSALEQVCLHDPDPTDRAFAMKALAARWSPESQRVLRERLFDPYHSVRLMAMELLGTHQDTTGDGLVLLPLQVMNPFQFLFFQHALARALPGQNAGEFLGLSPSERLARLGADAAGVSAYLKAARTDPNRPVAALALYALGSEEEAEAALAVLERILIDQGTRPDVFHSPDFWLRGDIIEVMGSTPQNHGERLSRMLERQWGADPTQRAFVLVALGYALERCPHAAAEAHLAKYRSLQTENFDLYLSGALGLTSLRSKEAFPSLLHVLGLKKQPFFRLAMDRLEQLTGVETPGKPEDFGALHNIGIPRESINMDTAEKFWSDWYREHGGKLKYDPKRDRFVIE